MYPCWKFVRWNLYPQNISYILQEISTPKFVNGNPGNLYPFWKLVMCGSKPRRWSLSNKSWWGTVSKAFLKSKNTAPISFCFSSWRNQSCVHSIRAETVDFPGWNPHWQLDSGWFSARWLLINLKKWCSKTLLIIGRSWNTVWATWFWSV